MNKKIKKKIVFNKVGGNASKNSISHKLTIPNDMIKAMGIDESHRYVELEINDNNIITIKIANDTL